MYNLDCSHNQLKSLDVSGCGDIENLDCSGNLIKKLDVSSLDYSYVTVDQRVVVTGAGEDVEICRVN